MPDINEQCWDVIGALGADEDGEPSPAAIARLVAMGLAELVDDKPRLTERGENAYACLESGGDFPGLE
jgi:hypothetical protein